MSEDNNFKQLSEITGVKIDSFICKGGFCHIYHGIDRETKEEAIVKAEYGKPNLNHRLRRETALLKSLSHPNLVKYIRHGHGEISSKEQVRYLVEEFLKGDNLETMISRYGPIKTEYSVNFMTQICDFLGYLHSKNRIFIDLQPNNIILSPGFKLKFIDLACVKKNPYENSSIAMGTPDFLPIDWFQSVYINKLSDIYVAGMLFYYLMTGKAPYETLADRAAGFDSYKRVDFIMNCHSYTPHPKIRDSVPGVSLELERIYQKMMTVDRRKRYQSMKEVLEDLREMD